MYAFIMMPHTLPQSYVRWIRKQGAKELYVWQGVRVRKRFTTASCTQSMSQSHVSLVGCQVLTAVQRCKCHMQPQS